MYITKILDKYGSYEDMAQTINKEANEMYEEGYELVCYTILPNTYEYMLTFKEIEK